MNVPKLLLLALLPLVLRPALAVEDFTTLTVTSGRPSSLPTQIPTTMEGIVAADIAKTVNATDAEDALKYFPSLLIRKRYIGDYDHAVLASRASGTGNSARSLVYADGILLSNLLGNGASFTPRWAMVTPEEIERVDVLYGPFSAAYSGNSVGAVVDYITRMPDALEMHARVSAFGEDFSVYSTDASYSGWQASASAGDRSGDLSWWVNFNRLDNDSHPITYANKLLTAGTPASSGTPVTGAVTDRNPRNQDWLILGAQNLIHTVQDHAKAKLAYDLSPTLRVNYLLGWWSNDASRTSTSYLRDAGGNAVYSGAINANGRPYTLLAADFPRSTGDLSHVMQGLSLKSHSQGEWDWEVAASLYDYARDLVRSATTPLPAAESGGAGSLTDQHGTGWNTLALRGTWHPRAAAAHIVDFGLQREDYRLRTLVSSTSDWLRGAPDARTAAFRGNSTLQSLYLQDTWSLADAWVTTVGLRYEDWEARKGSLSNASTTLAFAARLASYLSPKAAVSWQATPDWQLKASLGRAIRMPTVSELFQGSIATDVIVNNDPNLEPERSWTGELTAQLALASGSLRTTVFHEDTRDALYSQTSVTTTPAVTNIQNIEKLRTTGVEIAYQVKELFVPGLGLSASVTYADSKIVRNDRFPASTGKQQPRVPLWRANALASYDLAERWSVTLGARYAGRQYGNLDNSDVNAFTYTGNSSFFVVDTRTRLKFAQRWTASAGIDNLLDKTYWNFHPYNQRTWLLELGVDF